MPVPAPDQMQTGLARGNGVGSQNLRVTAARC